MLVYHQKEELLKCCYFIAVSVISIHKLIQDQRKLEISFSPLQETGSRLSLQLGLLETNAFLRVSLLSG